MFRKRVLPAALLMTGMLLWAQPGMAGMVQGRAWVAQGKSKTFAAGATVSISCENKSAEASASDKGAYRIKIDASGSCWLQVAHKGEKSNRIRLFLSDDSIRADLELRRDPRGKWSLTLK